MVGLTPDFVSSDEDVVEVDSAGLISVEFFGTATVTATLGAAVGTCAIEVLPTSVQQLDIDLGGDGTGTVLTDLRIIRDFTRDGSNVITLAPSVIGPNGPMTLVNSPEYDPALEAVYNDTNLTGSTGPKLYTGALSGVSLADDVSLFCLGSALPQASNAFFCGLSNTTSDHIGIRKQSSPQTIHVQYAVAAAGVNRNSGVPLSSAMRPMFACKSSANATKTVVPDAAKVESTCGAMGSGAVHLSIFAVSSAATVAPPVAVAVTGVVKKFLTDADIGIVTLWLESEFDQTQRAAPPAGGAVDNILMTPQALTLTLGNNYQVQGVARDSSNNLLSGEGVLYASSNNGVATVDPFGNVTPVGVGTCNITGSSASTPGATVDVCVVTIAAAVDTYIGLTPTSANVAEAATRQFIGVVYDQSEADGVALAFPTATAVTYSSTATGVATINSSTGLATGVAAGVANIEADAGGLPTAQATLTVVAVGAVATLLVWPKALHINTGETSQPLLARGYDSDEAVVPGAESDVTYALHASAVGFITVNSSTGAISCSAVQTVRDPVFVIATHTPTGVTANIKVWTYPTEHEFIPPGTPTHTIGPRHFNYKAQSLSDTHPELTGWSLDEHSRPRFEIVPQGADVNTNPDMEMGDAHWDGASASYGRAYFKSQVQVGSGVTIGANSGLTVTLGTPPAFLGPQGGDKHTGYYVEFANNVSGVIGTHASPDVTFQDGVINEWPLDLGYTPMRSTSTIPAGTAYTIWAPGMRSGVSPNNTSPGTASSSQPGAIPPGQRLGYWCWYTGVSRNWYGNRANINKTWYHWTGAGGSGPQLIPIFYGSRNNPLINTLPSQGGVMNSGSPYILSNTSNGGFTARPNQITAASDPHRFFINRGEMYKFELIWLLASDPGTYDANGNYNDDGSKDGEIHFYTNGKLILSLTGWQDCTPIQTPMHFDWNHTPVYGGGAFGPPIDMWQFVDRAFMAVWPS